MKKIWIIGASVAALTYGATALAAKGGIDFVESANAQLGLVTVSGMDSGYSIGGGAGMNLEKFLPNLSAEAVANYTLVAPSLSASFNVPFFGSYTTETKLNILNLGAMGVYSYPVNQQIKVRGKLGLVFQHTSPDVACSGSLCGSVTTSAGSTSEIEIAFGVGATYALDKKLGIIAEWTQYSTKSGAPGYLTAGAQFKF